MDKRYHTVRMDTSPAVGEIFASSLLKPAPAPDKWWKVMFSPVQMAGVPGGFAVTLQECDPKPEKGPVGDKVHALLRIPAPTPPEPTLGMIYAELVALRALVEQSVRHWAPEEVMRIAGELQQEVTGLRVTLTDGAQ